MRPYRGPTRIPRVPVKRAMYRLLILEKIKHLQTEVRPEYPGLVAYDLTAPAKMIYPQMIPFLRTASPAPFRPSWRNRLRDGEYRIVHRLATIYHAICGDYDEVDLWRG